MSWIDEVAVRLKKKNQILFAKDSEYMQDLIILLQSQNHRVVALWAFDFAEESINALSEKYPRECRPREALEAAEDWAAGRINIRIAQRKILDCHAFAKEIDCAEDIARCHAIGQACATVHTAGHAIGYPIYDLSAIIHKLGLEHCKQAVEHRKQEYIDQLFYWNEHWDEYKGDWANFMIK